MTEHDSKSVPTSHDQHFGFLGGVRVLDFADASGRYASRLLADLGAEVIRVISSNDDLVGPPPYAATAHGEVSLFDRFVAINSSVIQADIGSAAGRELLEQLFKVSDLLIDTPDEHEVTAHGYSTDQLITIAPQLNRLSVRGFGTGGSKSNIASDDLTVLASSGLLSLGGYPDTGPVEVGGLQSYFGRSIYGAVGALLVLLQGRKDGRGRHVEVAAQEVMAGALEDTIAEYDFNSHVRSRMGGVPRGAGTGTFTCSDGYVAMVAGRLGTAKAWVSLVAWLNEVGATGAEVLTEPEWSEYSFRSGPEATAVFTTIFENFASAWTKAELYHEGQKRLIPIAPVNSARDVLDNVQLEDRAFFHQILDPELNETLTVPGRPYREAAINDLPFVLSRVQAESSAAVLVEALGLSDDDVATLRREGVIQ